MRVTDDLGRTLDLPDFPRRVVSLVPSVTETLAAFGLSERLVGVTDWCTEPAEMVARLPRVGHVVAPDPARVSALEPDLVVANAEENREHAVRKLDAAGLPVYVTFPRTVEAAISGLQTLAALTATREAAAAYIVDAAAALADARRVAATHKPVPFFCPIWKSPWMTTSDDTYLADLLRTAGGRNVFGAEAKRYPQTTLMEALSRAPSVALLPTEPYPFAEGDRLEVEAEMPGIRVHLVDGALVAWHGIRTGAALRALARLFAGEPGAAAPEPR
ncbi:MAG: helical backbone metal receptor [Deltaproteobacteria bacterium]|nr:helical backbone metal receptor [Deltaproteobacteria bacterium]